MKAVLLAGPAEELGRPTDAPDRELAGALELRLHPAAEGVPLRHLRAEHCFVHLAQLLVL